MTAVAATYYFGDVDEGQSDDARQIREAGRKYVGAFQSGTELQPQTHLRHLSSMTRILVEATWSEPSESMFEYLAAHAPRDLMRLVGSNSLDPTSLTFAAEIAGRVADGAAVRRALIPLLNDDSPLVREGAIYGLRDHADDVVLQRLRELAASDKSPGVRRAAGDTLNDL
jgi:hypothetical protein